MNPERAMNLLATGVLVSEFIEVISGEFPLDGLTVGDHEALDKMKKAMEDYVTYTEGTLPKDVL